MSEKNILEPTKRAARGSSPAQCSACASCGYQWVTGTNGSHSCAEHLQKQIKRLERALQTENRILEILIAGGFVKREKVEEARNLVFSMQ